MKTIKVQVPQNCDTCRFNVKGVNEDCKYCLAYLKTIFKDELGSCIPVSDCVEVDKK